MTLNLNNGRAVFFQIKDLDARANVCKNVLNPATIKKDNGAVATKKNLCDTNGTNNYIN